MNMLTALRGASEGTYMRCCDKAHFDALTVLESLLSSLLFDQGQLRLIMPCRLLYLS